MSNYEKLKKVFIDVLGEDGIQGFSEVATMEDIEKWDSMNFLNLVMGIEGEFDVRVGGLEAAQLTSVPAILSFLAEHK